MWVSLGVSFFATAISIFNMIMCDMNEFDPNKLEEEITIRKSKHQRRLREAEQMERSKLKTKQRNKIKSQFIKEKKQQAARKKLKTNEGPKKQSVFMTKLLEGKQRLR